MTVWTALATLPGPGAAEALGAAMERLDPAPAGVGVFEVEDGSGVWEVQGFFEAPPDRAGLALLEALHGTGFAVSKVPQTDWVAKVRRELHPVSAGRFFVHGSHDADQVPAGRVALLIEAAMAFGTGHHGTTRGCLLALERLADGPAPDGIWDLGCGTAVLAMAAARVWDVPAVASDIDATAIEVARANVAANGLAARVTCVKAEGPDHETVRAGAPYGLVFANILLGPLLDLAPRVAAAVAPGGHLILSGILSDQAAAIVARYAQAGLSPVAEDPIGDWTTLTLKRNLNGSS